MIQNLPLCVKQKLHEIELLELLTANLLIFEKIERHLQTKPQDAVYSQCCQNAGFPTRSSGLIADS